MAAYQSQNVVLGFYFAGLEVGAWTVLPTKALLATVKVRLSHDPNFNPAPSNQLSDFVPNECDFTGYTAGGIALTLQPNVSFTPSTLGAIGHALFQGGTITPFVVDKAYGYWVDDGTGIVLAERFANGLIVSFTNAASYLALDVSIPVETMVAVV